MKDISKITEKDKGKNFSSFADGMVKISSALPDLVKNLKELGNLQQRRVDAGIMTLRKLYEFMHEMGDGRHARRVEKAISLFDKISKHFVFLSDFHSTAFSELNAKFCLGSSLRLNRAASVCLLHQTASLCLSVLFQTLSL